MPDPARPTLRRRIALFGAALAALAAAGCSRVPRFGMSAPVTEPPSKEPPTWFVADCWLGTEDVVPPHKGKAGGSAAGTLTLATGLFEWRVNAARLSGPATVVGFYGPAATGSNGPLAIQLPLPSEGEPRNDGTGAGYERTGTSRLTPAQMADLMAGLWYVSVSTQAWPGGEVRGQLKRSTWGVHGG
ncbi:CHRD domain protein [Variovorax boronicumulans]|uniref:CHRD domain-containing protein n=1 Tax=Variovorax boronicumulans TaxID=436515 RepID=UPI000BB37728|nr:CHRD domain-containing protein [Variovorax boronicumulans]PBI88709.1 CHRD domain protein [Variovorax boronicumulans]